MCWDTEDWLVSFSDSGQRVASRSPSGSVSLADGVLPPPQNAAESPVVDSRNGSICHMPEVEWDTRTLPSFGNRMAK